MMRGGRPDRAARKGVENLAGNISAPGQARWSSKAAFVLAATGSAVGLGNLWRFPTEAGNNGGGAFVLLYILCVVLIAMPLLLAESLIGRHGQRSTIASAAYLARQSGASPVVGRASSRVVLPPFYRRSETKAGRRSERKFLTA